MPESLSVQRQVRFALHQLSAENGSFKFEALARRLARQTVSRNLLPATGPVQSGGDQGRDAETYRTELPGQVQRIGREHGLVEGVGIAVACTLQKVDVLVKFASDIASIVQSGTPVGFIAAYCEADVPIARRHEFRDAMQTTHGVHVEVFDGTAIAELLAERSLFWIAREFLDFSIDAFPEDDLVARPDWYESDLARWQTVDSSTGSFGDLTDLTGCVRCAMSHEDGREDLEFWMSKLEPFTANAVYPRLRNLARYEFCLAQLRGFRDMRPVDPMVTDFIEGALESGDSAALNDAATLAAYTCGAVVQGVTSHTPREADSWIRRLIDQFQQRLVAADSAGARCELLATLSFLRLQIDFTAFRDSDELDLIPPVRAQPSNLDPEVLANIERLPAGEYPMIDVDGVFLAWEGVLEASRDSPLFPIERVNRLVRLLSNVLIDDPRFDPVAREFDERIGARLGEIARGEGIRGRAMDYYSSGRLLEALRDLHRVQVAWFSGSANDGLFITLRMTGSVYEQLNLFMAAKQQGLLAAHFLPPNRERDVWRALVSIARAEYHQGAWFSAIEFCALALRTYEALEENAYGDEPSHDELGAALIEIAIIREVANRLGGAHQRYVDEVLSRWGTDAEIDSMLETLPEEPWWAEVPTLELLDRVRTELGYAPFSDAGPTRSHSWMALGVHWRVRFANDAVTTQVAERFIAAAQILAADLALRDPCYWPTEVTIDIEALNPTSAPTCEEAGFEERGQRLRVGLPRIDDSSRDSIEPATDSTLAVVVQVFASVSALSEPEFMTSIEGAIINGIHTKLVPGTIYDVAWRAIASVKEAEFEDRRRAELGEEPQPPESPLLAMPPSHGPGFSAEDALERASSIYDDAPAVLRNTLPALRRDSAFLEVARQLGREGWLDRHLLLMIWNIAQNWHYVRPGMSPNEMREVGRRFRDPEPEGAMVPLSEFTLERMKRQLATTQLSTARGLGLVFRPERLEESDIDRLLRVRYDYWITDVPHAAVFAPDGARGRED
jgi:hypothetical protein